ncbi:MAG: hypothetical protein MST01_08445 [Prevotella sp.]|nr:hypothetical protein [Prevotella sp.]
MNRINNYVLNGAIALLSTAGFVACSSSDDVTDAPVNPTYDGKNVKTQFAINIATPSNGKTRMSAANTQNDNNFLGMNSIKLFPFSSDPGKDVNWTRNISLTQINDGITSDNSSKIYSNVEIPVGTNNFLFYGFGPMGETQEDKFKKGMLTTNFPSEVATAPSSISASLVPILGTENEMSTIQGYYTTYLNGIKDVNGWSTTDDISLRNAYDLFITIGSTGVRCGSANAILKTVELLYNLAIDRKTASTSTDVQTLAEAIKTAITTTSGDIQVTATARTNDATHYDLSYSGTDDKYSFPTNLGLPEGAAQLEYGESGFSYKNTPTIGASGSILNVYGLTYPSSIAYTANTRAKASTEIFEATEWPKTVSDWDDTSKWPSTSSWTNEVVASTRSVALVNNINYSVASLKTTVKCNEASLEDNRANVINDGNPANQTISVPSEGFKVTGVLVGGQPNKVDWQFLDNGSERSAVIYDKDLTNIVAESGTESAANYTLVFDNWKNNETQDDVLMAIELENNSESDFYGVDGIILKGQKFYLVAKLVVSSAGTSSITWPGDAYRYPKKNTTRVFMQDYTTTAKLNIKSLKNAYSTIPDLRSVELQLGLSVDLEWKTGLTYDVNID